MRDLFSPTTTTVRGKRLLISFSGGRTSAYMVWLILNLFAHLWEEILVVFANTGQENEATLEFVHKCDKYFGFNTVWVEAVVNPEKGQGTRHKVVTYETASRNGEPFESVMSKYGISNMKYPHCTRELKLAAIESYAKSIGWNNDYVTAIGIRPDEDRRVSAKAIAHKIVYPLIDWHYADKQDVNDFWEEQLFNLELQEHQGNCKWCWKKSFKKHALLLQENSDIYDFPLRMESLYGNVGKERDPEGTYPRVFFRQNMSTNALKSFCSILHSGSNPSPQIDLDANGGCSESCELFPTHIESFNHV